MGEEGGEAKGRGKRMREGDKKEGGRGGRQKKEEGKRGSQERIVVERGRGGEGERS